MDQEGGQQPPTAPQEGYAKKIFTPKNIIIYIVVAVIAYGAIYFFSIAKKGGYQGQGVGGTTGGQLPRGQEATTSAPQPLLVALSTENNSGQDGIAILSEEAGKTKVTLTLSNSPGDVAQPAHIHDGQCPGVGAVKYPLNNVVNGQSETTIDATIAQLKQVPLAVNVHKSADEAKTYVACGNITS